MAKRKINVAAGLHTSDIMESPAYAVHPDSQRYRFHTRHHSTNHGITCHISRNTLLQSKRTTIFLTSAQKHFVKSRFDVELWMFGSEAFQFDCHLLTRRYICTWRRDEASVIHHRYSPCRRHVTGAIGDGERGDHDPDTTTTTFSRS